MVGVGVKSEHMKELSNSVRGSVRPSADFTALLERGKNYCILNVCWESFDKGARASGEDRLK